MTIDDETRRYILDRLTLIREAATAPVCMALGRVLAVAQLLEPVKQG